MNSNGFFKLKDLFVLHIVSVDNVGEKTLNDVDSKTVIFKIIKCSNYGISSFLEIVCFLYWVQWNVSNNAIVALDFYLLYVNGLKCTTWHEISHLCFKFLW